MTTPTLTFCIATWNRADLLRQTLESIIGQANDEVEIVVVDGGSADHTSDVVEELRREFSYIRYLRLDEKGGVDQDFARAVDMAAGEYCWLFSDDDILSPGAIQAVLDAIDRKYSLIIVNAEVRGSSFDTLIEERRLKHLENREYLQSEFEQFFIDTANYLTFIGAVVIKKQIWDSRRVSDYFGTEFVHVGVIFQKPIPGRTIVLSHPHISIRYGHAQWTSRSIDIWMHKWPDLLWSLPAISDRAKRKVGRGPSKSLGNLKMIALLRAQGAFGREEYRKWIRPNDHSRLFRTLMFLIALFPGPLLNLLAMIYFQGFSHTSGIAIYDLHKSRYYYLNFLKEMLSIGNSN